LDQTPEIVTGKLTLVDGEGRPRIIIGTSTDGEPSLRMFDRSGNELLVLGLTAKDAGQDAEGSTLRMAASDDGAQAEILVSPGNTAFIEIQQGQDHDSSNVLLEVEKPDGVNQAHFVVSDETAAMEMTVKRGKAMTAIGTDAT